MMLFKDKKVAILGWAVDTQDVEPWLQAQGAQVTILDEKEQPFGDLTSFDVLVRSPGVYRYRPELIEAEKAGVVITSKTKILFDVCPGRIIGVTGTKGKGTTTTLIYELLKAGGKQAFLGGNIGQGVFQYLDQMTPDSYAVLELSSFQLIDLHKSPHIAVVLMTTSEHLNWHKDLQEYLDAKANLVKFQTPNDWVVANKDYQATRQIAGQGQGQKVWVTRDSWKGPMRLRGEHNRENVAAAVAVAKILEIDDGTIKKVIKDFKGLEHRLEEVAEVQGVTYYDDSFSTTPETTIAAIKAFSEPTILIVGGSEKGSDFTQLGKVIAESKNVKAVVLIGLMATKIKQAIIQAGGRVKLLEGARNMHQIIAQTKEVSEPGDVVVLSPAAASFDMFTNYKDRGDQFKEEVKKLLN